MDDSEAMRLCSEAAEIVGRGCDPVGAAKAAEMFRIVADEGYPDGMFGLAEMKMNGLGTPKDVKGAADLYRAASDKGNIPALFRLANVLVQEESLLDADEAFRCMKRCAEAKFPPAFGCIGDMLYYGIGTAPSPADAVNWYRLAAASGDPQSMYKVGCMCRMGNGVPKDDSAADAMFVMAANAGIPEAQFEIASRIYDGEMEGGKGEAASWYSKCADAIPTAKFNLATMYLEGDGVTKDPAKAFSLYKELGDGCGDADALYQVGRMYLDGLGTDANPEEGFRYFGKAANAGHKEASMLVESLRRRMNTQLITIDGTEDASGKR